MKILYQYSAEGHPTKFVWDKFKESRGQNTDVLNGKEQLTTKIHDELNELANSIKLSDTLDEQKILAKINEEGSNSEKYVRRSDGTMILKDRVNKEKVKITAGNVLKIKDRKGDEILKVDLNTNEIKRNNGFTLEKKEDIPVVPVDPEIDPTVIVTPEVVVEVNETMKKYERAISLLGTGIDGMNQDALTTLRGQIEALRTEIDGNEKLKPDEKVALKKQLDALIARIEAREKELSGIEKENQAQKDIEEAQRLIDAIDLSTLNITNYQTFSTPIEAARQALLKVKESAKPFPDLAEKIPGLEAQLDKKENQVELYKTGATEKENVEKEYQEKTDVQLTAMDKEIKDKVDAYTKELEGKEKKLENLTLSSLTIDQTKEPQSYEEIQKGMQAHRLDSMMMIEEVNFLQECGQTFAEEIADFEEEKSAFTFPNIARSLVASAAIIPGTLWDLGEKALGTGKRAGDRFGWLGFGDSRAEELQKKQVQFETDFTAKQIELETKKTAVDTYGDKLQINSETLKNEAPTNVQTTVQEKIAAQMATEGIDPTVEPWKGIQEKIAVEFQKTAVETVQPAVDQLDMMVDGSVPELEKATDTSLKAALDTSDYIKSLDIHSATVLDMSIGFLTKNVAKGLNGVGDVLAMNPVTGVLGGVCRAAGGLVEGVGTLITDPDKVVKGLGTLVGVDGWKEAGEAWAGMGSAFLGGEAWKTAAEAWKSGDYWKALSEGTAAVGEGGGNIVATFFTGGLAAESRGAGLVGRLGTMTGKVGSGVMKFARVTRTTKAVLAARKFVIKSGEIGAKIGDVALAPLKYGLKPLRMFGKVGRSMEAVTSRVFTPTKWAKLKPGSAAAEKAANKLVNKGAKLDGKIEALQNKIRGTEDAFERKFLTKDMDYLKLKRMRLDKEMNSLLGKEKIAVVNKKAVIEKERILPHPEESLQNAKIRVDVNRAQMSKLKGELTKSEDLVTAARRKVAEEGNAVQNTRGMKKIEARYKKAKLDYAQAQKEFVQAQKDVAHWKTVNNQISQGGVKTISRNGGSVWAGVAAASAIPLAYNAVEIEKNKNKNIKENVPAKTKFERTPLVDLDGSPAPVNGAPVSGPQQTVNYEIADKQRFEDVRKDQLESFFKTKNTTDEKNIKADILNYSAQDVEVVIDGVSGKTLTDIWDLKGNGKVLAFSLDSKMGKDNEPDLTKIDIRIT